jgi:hypothetical protein
MCVIFCAPLNAQNPTQADAPATPANYVELRASGSESGFYRYAEYARTFSNRLVLDILYLGVPGQNEFYAGLGYQFTPTEKLTFTPLVYGVTGRENRQRGVAFGAFTVGSIADWNIYSFAGVFTPVAGDVPAYFFLDTLDLTRSISKRWELGGSGGLFCSLGTCSRVIGPVLVLNDKKGSWRTSARAGTATEVRLTRTFVF